MFDKLKQANELRKMHSEAKAMQKELASITQSMEERGIKVIVTADQKIAYLSIDGNERRDVVEVTNKAFKEVQKKAAKKMMEMGGGLGGLLGKLS